MNNYLVDGLEHVNYDVLVHMVGEGQLTGSDLISLCESSIMMNNKCNTNNQEIFQILLNKEYGIKSDNPRKDYIKLNDLSSDVIVLL